LVALVGDSTIISVLPFELPALAAAAAASDTRLDCTTPLDPLLLLLLLLLLTLVLSLTVLLLLHLARLRVEAVPLAVAAAAVVSGRAAAGTRLLLRQEQLPYPDCCISICIHTIVGNVSAVE
jgi:hypothetical protein